MKFKWLNHSKIARSISLSKYETTLTPFPASHQKIILNTTPFNAAVHWHKCPYSFAGAYLLGFFFGFKKKKPAWKPKI
jgi:hypothetical protein